MVLSFVKNNSIQNAASEIFIHTDDNFNQSDFTLTVLLPEKAFCSKVSRSSPYVSTWSQRLKLTPEEYLQQLLLALQRKSKPRSSQNGSVKEESAPSNGTNEEHVFQVEKSVLTWKQYFPDKQIYGKRGAIPLEECNYSSTVWELLQESVLKHTEAQDEIHNLEKANADLKQKVVKARALADESLQAKDKFQQQCYAKFCALINSKKEKIRQLEEALQNSPGPSSAPDACTSGATSSSVAAVAAGKNRPNTTVISHSGATQNQGTHNSGDEYDDDTDVDDVSKCDTDEENEEIKSRNHVMSNAREKTSKNRAVSRHAASGSKREAPDKSSQSCKKASLGDSQDDLFNSSVEGASLALLSSIKPRATTSGKVSYASSLRSSDSNFCRGATANNVRPSHNSPIFLESSCCTKPKNSVEAVEDDDPASVVARILRKNALMRKANGIDMPRRVDEFDVHSSGGGSAAGVEVRQRALDSDLKMSWALEAADEKSACSPFLGDAGNCNLGQNTRSSVSDINASVSVDQCEPIDQLENGRGKESTVNDVNQSSEFDLVDKSRKFPADSKDARQGSSSRGGRRHDYNDEENMQSLASSFVPKYEANTQLSSERDPASDDSIVILSDGETDAPANVASCQFSNDKGVEENNLLDCQNTSNIEAPNSLPHASSETSNLIGVPKMKRVSQCSSQAPNRSSKRSITPRAPRKKTRVLERDLIEHNFRSGSVIEEILM